MKKPFKETKVGQFLESKGFNTVLKYAENAVPGIGLLNSVKEMVLGNDPEIKLTPEDREQFLRIYQEQIHEYDLMLRDVQDARQRWVEINNSEKAPMLSKTLAPIVVYIMIAFTISIVYTILFKESKVENDIIYLILGTILGEFTGSIRFVLGGSARSKEKDNIIQSILKQK